MCSSQENDLICACHPCASHISVSFKKKPDFPSQIIHVILVQEPCSSIQSHAIFVRGACNSVQKKKLRHPCAGKEATSSASRGLLLREIRTFGRALEGSIVSPLVNTMGGLSGERRGGDMSGAASAPSLVVARLLARALALDLACGIRCPPFVIRKAYASDQHTPTQELSHALTVLFHSACQALYFPRICVRSLAASRSRGPLGAEPYFLTPLLQPQCCLQRSLEGEGDRVQAEHNARPPFLALDFPARLRSAVPDVRYQLHW